MLKNLKEGIEKVNELFGTSIGVELNDEVFYAGSANATLGEDVEEPEEPEENPIEEDTGSAAVDNENDDENGGEETTEDKKSEDDTKEGEE